MGWDIVDFSSETAERNSSKLDRRQESSTKIVFRLIRAKIAIQANQ